MWGAPITFISAGENTEHACGVAHMTMHIYSVGNQHTAEAKRKVSEARAGPYPAFVNLETGEVIPAGRNLTNLCRELGLRQSCMCAVKTGRQPHHKGWELVNG